MTGGFRRPGTMAARLRAWHDRCRTFLAGLAADRRGNVLMIVAAALLPLTFAAGMGIDYSRAMRIQTKLNAAADAAALAAVTQPMMNQSSTTACAVARKMFIAQATSLGGLVMDASDPAQLTITITDSATPTSGSTTTTCASGGASSSTTASYSRTTSVTYRMQSQNAFAGILGVDMLTVKGSSQANSAVAPNIDFYLMLDTSPSMLLPATSGGLASMIAATSAQGDISPKGCAFACHQTSTTSSDPGGTPQSGGVYLDNYQVARNNGISLRTDLVTTAVQQLTTDAQTTSTANHASYRMGIFDFDYMFRQIWPTSAIGGVYVDSNLTQVSSHVTDAKVLTYCRNNQRICGTNDNDMGTNFTAAFTGALANMPTKPGSGTTTPGDTPQAILFLITDGMRDENVSGGRVMGPIPAAQCTTIKNRGIRIAILDTQYLPASASDSWSVANVKTPFLVPDKISPALIACASPGLFYQVTTDGDIAAALSALFQKAVATAHLTQ
jgi:Flp pilus assembly protein TadG